MSLTINISYFQYNINRSVYVKRMQLYFVKQENILMLRNMRTHSPWLNFTVTANGIVHLAMTYSVIKR
jgi:hypothetical protein